MAEEPQADPRFQKAVQLFNDGEWYDAHDVFEELWHETANPCLLYTSPSPRDS